MDEKDDQDRPLVPTFSGILSLLAEKSKGEESTWFPFIQILPKTFHTPLFWSPADLDELKGTSLHVSLEAQNISTLKELDYIRQQEKLLQRIFPSSDTDTPSTSQNLPKEIKTSDWLWAFSVFRSRHLKIENFLFMFPIVDLFNFANKANVDVIIEGEVVKLVAAKDILSGQPLHINDGLVGNRDLLDYYGFVIQDNIHDYYPVGIGLDNSDSLYMKKKGLFQRKGIKEGAVFPLQRLSVNQELIFALRIYHLSVYDFSEADNAFDGKMISVQNEYEVCNSLIDLCEASLEGLTHSIKSDNIMLNKKIPFKLRSAIRIRKAEKRILLANLKLAKQILEKVEEQWQYRSYDIPTGMKEEL
eukprot:TRINITY_DN2932_c0_g1_i1.p1 TRINITY_DN2932_c0_g1~~TRINITY_DN2932_c0_g1_i1.p1  ORF type:complete len:359 (+),score=65.43 TRINITY_DN2932_c0_g1_i1:290-1366(+)